MHRHPLPFLAAALLAWAAPAVAQSASDEPPLGAAFDSAAVVSALAALPAPPGVPPLLELRFDSTGAFAGGQGVGGSGPAEYVRLVAEAVRGHSRTLPFRAGGYGILATVGGGPVPVFASSAFVAQAPSLRDPRRVQRMMQELVVAARRDAAWEAGMASGAAPASPGSPSVRPPTGRAELRLRFRVLADGTVEHVTLARRSRRPTLDAEAVRMARSLRFNPAMVNGNAVPAYVILPVTVAY